LIRHDALRFISLAATLIRFVYVRLMPMPLFIISIRVSPFYAAAMLFIFS